MIHRHGAFWKVSSPFRAGGGTAFFLSCSQEAQVSGWRHSTHPRVSLFLPSAQHWPLLPHSQEIPVSLGESRREEGKGLALWLWFMENNGDSGVSLPFWPSQHNVETTGSSLSLSIKWGDCTCFLG